MKQILSIIISVFALSLPAAAGCDITDHLARLQIVNRAADVSVAVKGWDIIAKQSNGSLIQVSVDDAISFSYVDTPYMKKTIREKLSDAEGDLRGAGVSFNSSAYIDPSQDIYGFEIFGAAQDGLYGLLDLRLSNTCNITFAWRANDEAEYEGLRAMIYQDFTVLRGYFPLRPLKPSTHLPMDVWSLAAVTAVGFLISGLTVFVGLRAMQRGRLAVITIYRRLLAIAPITLSGIFVVGEMAYFAYRRQALEDVPLMAATGLLIVGYISWALLQHGRQWEGFAALSSTSLLGMSALSFYGLHYHPFGPYLMIASTILSAGLFVPFWKHAEAIERKATGRA